MRFSAIYKPTALFSLKDSNFTNSGAKSLLLPSPYAIKMAFLNQAISLGGENFKANPSLFNIVCDVEISYYIEGLWGINNCLIKIQKKREDNPFDSTVSFREYVYMNGSLEVIFEVKSLKDKEFLMKYLYTINYFGKRGCFFQFIEYKDYPNEANVTSFNIKKMPFGVLQVYDDFDKGLSFEDVDNYSDKKTTKREKKILVLPLSLKSSSKSYTIYSINNNEVNNH